jgi:hypothetical protein
LLVAGADWQAPPRRMGFKSTLNKLVEFETPTADRLVGFLFAHSLSPVRFTSD